MPSQSTRDPALYTVRTLFEQTGQSGWFMQLLARTQALQSLQVLFDQECPLELIQKCHVLGIKDACLALGVNHASFATQLQYRTRELLHALKKYPEFKEVKKIYVKII